MVWPSRTCSPDRTLILTIQPSTCGLIAADSRDFYRSSEIPLNGEDAPRTTVVDLTNLPAGTYQVTAMLIDVQGGMTAMQQFTFVCRGQ